MEHTEMKPTNHVQLAGTCGILGGLLWVVAIVIEYGFRLQPPNNGTLFYINQVMFFVAEGGWVIAIAGLMWAHAAGRGWFGRIALGLFAFGWSLLALATPISAITHNPDLPLFPIGGLTTTVGGLLAGIAVAVAGRWYGWQRWSVLGYALYYLLVLFIPTIVNKHGPGMIVEAIWGLAWLPIGFALLSSGSVQTQPAVA
jgi:hypothetical protein